MSKQNKAKSDEGLFDATLAFYDCVLGERSWEEALATLLPYFDGRAANIQLHDEDRLIALHAAGHAPQTTRQAYTNHYIKIDWRTQRSLNAKIGDLLLDQHWSDAKHVDRSELYQDFLIPNGYRYAAGAKVAQHGNLSAIFAVLRAGERGEYTECEARQITAINQHLGRAISLMWKMQGLERKLITQRQTLDALTFAVLVADKTGRLRHVNRQAEQLNKQLTAIKLSNNKLRCSVPREQVELNAVLHSVIEQGVGSGMRLYDASTGDHWNLWAAPAHDGFGFASERLAVIVITNPNQPPSAETLLRSAFGFTTAEVKLAHALAAGSTVAEYAESAGISIATARTHVRAILGKAGVRRQTDFLRSIGHAGLISTKGP